MLRKMLREKLNEEGTKNRLRSNWSSFAVIALDSLILQDASGRVLELEQTRN